MPWQTMIFEPFEGRRKAIRTLHGSRVRVVCDAPPLELRVEILT
jgi:hypothetical protein